MESKIRNETSIIKNNESFNSNGRDAIKGIAFLGLAAAASPVMSLAQETKKIRCR